MAKAQRPTIHRLLEELHIANRYAGLLVDLLTTQHVAHARDMIGAYCKETGRDPSCVTQKDVVAWATKNGSLRDGQLQLSARRVALTSFYDLNEITRKGETGAALVEEDGHLNPGLFELVFQDDEERREMYNAEFSLAFQQ